MLHRRDKRNLETSVPFLPPTKLDFSNCEKKSDREARIKKQQRALKHAVSQKSKESTSNKNVNRFAWANKSSASNGMCGWWVGNDGDDQNDCSDVPAAGNNDRTENQIW